jgi:hypothetical protein
LRRGSAVADGLSVARRAVPAPHQVETVNSYDSHRSPDHDEPRSVGHCRDKTSDAHADQDRTHNESDEDQDRCAAPLLLCR